MVVVLLVLYCKKRKNKNRRKPDNDVELKTIDESEEKEITDGLLGGQPRDITENYSMASTRSSRNSSVISKARSDAATNTDSVVVDVDVHEPVTPAPLEPPETYRTIHKETGYNPHERKVYCL